jgi:hypothetical protein
MITENGKNYIARNFGVNNCYALEEVVPCTVYTEGAPNEQVLDTAMILFLLVTEVADWVRTAAGKFVLSDLMDANDGSYISMMDALEIEAYCIAGAPPVTPPYVPPVTPPTTPLPGAKDFEILNPSVNCDSKKCYARFNLKNNTGSGSAYVRLEVDGAPCYKRYAYITRGAEKPQVLSTSIADLSPGYHNLTIIVGKVTDTDSYTHRFLVAGAGIEPPAAAAQITPAEIAAELGRRGAIDTAAVSTTVGKDKWYIVHGEWGGTWLNYVTTNFIKSLSLDIDVRNPPTRASDISLKANHNVVNELDRSWVLARLAELPGAPAAAPPVTPPVTPPYTPPVTPTAVPEAIKAWIVANYGDGTRVTSSGWLKLYDANMANVLAPLPSGYTKASITEGVVQWAKANPNWEIKTICGWISSIGVTNLTEDHGRYIHSLAIGWTTIANDFYDKLSPKPPIPPTAIVTEDNGRGVYGYAIGWNTLANEFTGCNF